MFGYVYKTVNLINGRAYIGQHTGTFDPQYLGSGKLLNVAISKYGRENFEVQILEFAASKPELDAAEKRCIATASERLYNIALGGTGGFTLANATKHKKKRAAKKRSVGMKRWHARLSEEDRIAHGKKISLSRKGQPSNRLGKPHSAATKRKQSASNIAAAKLRGPEWFENHAKAMAKRRGKPSIRSRKPIMIDCILFESVTAACIHFGVTRTTIMNWRKSGKAFYA